MNFELGEEQIMLKNSAREFLDKECPKKHVRAMMDDEKGYSPELWKKMAGLGWQGLVFPEQYGGVGSSFLDLVVLLEEMGRALIPAPFLSTVVQAGRAILLAGNEQQKKEYITKIANGDLIMTMALTETNGGTEAADITMKARPADGAFVLNGKKMFVPDAHAANNFIVVARTKNTARKENGITLFLVDAKTSGIKIEKLKTMSGEKLCAVDFNNVSVPAANILGTVDKGWQVVKQVLEEAIIAECAWMTGGARWVLETTIEYAKSRIQFGRAIGTFQAIQHKLANVAVEVEGCTSLTYYAAWTATENDSNRALAASMAKAWVSDSYKHATFEGVQVHGGIGFTWDHDMHLYFKRAKHGEIVYGDGDYHREKVAQLIKM
jgi:alkylation response protein AidB-like acyl-CoA dehydrogenase